MTKSIKITRTALTVKISFEKGDISLTFQDEKVLTMFIDLYKDTNAELYLLISDFMNAGLITEEAGADYPPCAYLDRNYIEFMPLLEEVDK